MKKLLAALAVLFAGLLAIVVGRAATMESLQPGGLLEGVADTPAGALDEEGAVARFVEAVRIPTISFENTAEIDSTAFRTLHDHFERAYPRVHEALTRETVAGLSLLFTWEGSEPELEPVVLMGHMDVVPVIPGTEEDWAHPPFAGVVADGFVWGRGSMDDKVSVVSVLEAVEWLLAEGFRPRRTHYLAFGHDEEVGGVRGAAGIAALLAERGAEPYAYVVDEGGAIARGMIPGIEGAVALVGIAEKGYVNLELLVEGGGGHSSTPPAQTSIGVLAAAIARLEADPFPARLDGAARRMFEYLAPEMSFGARVAVGNLWLFGPLAKRLLLSDPSMASMVRTTTAVTIVEGGVKANVLPIRARAVVNHRILPGETRETVLERVRSVVDDPRVEVRVLGAEGTDPSPVSDPDGAAFRLLAATVRQVLPAEEVVVAPYLVMGGTDAKWYSGRSPDVFRFLAAPVEADALERVHGTNERMGVDGYFSSIRFFRQLIRNSDAL